MTLTLFENDISKNWKNMTNIFFTYGMVLWCILYFFDNTVLNIYFMHSRPFCCHLLTALLNSVYVVNEDSSIKVKRWLRLHGVSLLIVSITKFSIVIGSPRAYLSRNRRSITCVSNYRCPIWTFSNRTPVIGRARDRPPITWQIGARRNNHDREFCYRYD